MPGPAPKSADQRVRRNAPLANTVRLPSEGRPGDAPAWPLKGDEPEVWASLWSTPQAVAWERLGWTRVVARYCRVLERCDDPEAGAAILGEARQMEDRLGLTPMAMLRLRWEVSADEVAERRETETAPAPKRRTLKVVGDAVAGA